MPDLSWMDDPDTYPDEPDPGCTCADCHYEREFIVLISPLLNEVTS